MPNQLSYQLFELIKSLSKAEKRHFKIYANRNHSDKSVFFIQLFNTIDKMLQYDETKITAKFPSVKGNLLSNHKAHLYEQILVSLRLLHHKKDELRIKELISFADVLHQKGLYQQSLLQLTKARQLAEACDNNILRLEIVEHEKQIESHYITRSHEDKAKFLVKESEELGASIAVSSAWSNLALKMYDYYLKFGHSKNESGYKEVRNYFTSNIPKATANSFYAKLYYHQSYAWFNYIIQNFASCYKHSKEWVAMFNETQKKKHPDLYMKGLHNCLSSLFYCNDYQRFKTVHEQLEDFILKEQNHFNQNENLLAFIYNETAKLNSYFLQGKFSDGMGYCDELESKLNHHESYLDLHRIFMFHYKMACLKFGAESYKGAIKHLNFIINQSNYNLKEDIQCFARILNLIAHYELGNDELIEYQVKSTYRYLLKMKNMQKVQVAILHFLKQTIHEDKKHLTPYFIKLKNELEIIYQDKFELRPTLYLDIISWLESKLTGKKVEAIIWKKKR